MAAPAALVDAGRCTGTCRCSAGRLPMGACRTVTRPTSPRASGRCHPASRPVLPLCLFCMECMHSAASSLACVHVRNGAGMLPHAIARPPCTAATRSARVHQTSELLKPDERTSWCIGARTAGNTKQHNHACRPTHKKKARCTQAFFIRFVHTHASSPGGSM